jgi:hypothetical protein
VNRYNGLERIAVGSTDLKRYNNLSYRYNGLERIAVGSTDLKRYNNLSYRYTFHETL